MTTPLAQISSAGAPGRRRQAGRRRATRQPKRSLIVPAEIDRLIAQQAEDEGRTYTAIVADRLRDSFGLAPDKSPAN